MDRDGEPSMVKCQTMTYMGAVYFVINTISSVGFGDIVPTTIYSKLLLVILIFVSMTVIPIQINELLFLLSSVSSYKRPYVPQAGENHVIVCGHANAKDKLEAFFKEFFHPDRMFSNGPEYHVVILCAAEPVEEVRNLIVSPMLDARVTYVIGSALNGDDLKRAGADTASAMFILGNTNSKNDALEDAATVLRTLSASNYNSDMELLVQVLHSEDREILKDSDVEVILCLDEYKTMLMARNSICPGFSTFIENIFQSFGGVSDEAEEMMAPWYSEYIHGARMELYYVPLDQDFLRAIDFSFDKLCEAVFLEWSIVVLGLCNAEQDSITFNPGRKDLGRHKTFKSFFQEFNVALIIADDNLQAEDIATSLSNAQKVGALLEKIEQQEDIFPVRHTLPRGATPGRRGLVRNRVISPQNRAPSPLSKPLGKPPELGKLGMSFLQKLQSKSMRGKALRSAHSKGESDFDSDESDLEESYIGYARVRKGGQIVEKKVREACEFDRATVVYTKSHSTADEGNSQQSSAKAKEVFPRVNIVIDSSVPNAKQQRRSVMMKMMPVPIQKLADNERPGKGGTRAARKSMAIPIVKKRMTLIHQVSSIREGSDEESDESDKSGEADATNDEVENDVDGCDRDDRQGKTRVSGREESKFRASLSVTLENDEHGDGEDRSHQLITDTLNRWGSVLKDGTRKKSQLRPMASWSGMKSSAVSPSVNGSQSAGDTPGTPAASTPTGPSRDSPGIELHATGRHTPTSSPSCTASPTPPKHSRGSSSPHTPMTPSAPSNQTSSHENTEVDEVHGLSIKPTARRLPPLSAANKPVATPSPFKPKVLPKKRKIVVEGPSSTLISPENIAAAKSKMKAKKLRKIKLNKVVAPRGTNMEAVLQELKKRIPEKDSDNPETLSHRSSGASNRSSEGRPSSENGNGKDTPLIADKPVQIPVGQRKVAGPQVIDTRWLPPGHGGNESKEQQSPTTPKGYHRASTSDIPDGVPSAKPVDTSRGKSVFTRSALAFGTLIGLGKKRKAENKSPKSTSPRREEQSAKTESTSSSAEGAANEKDGKVKVKAEIDGHVVLTDDLTPGNYGTW